MRTELFGKAMGGHQSAAWLKDEWLTPPELVRALGSFDLDPCAPVSAPWALAKTCYTVHDNGLKKPWEGRVWLNPPYGLEAAEWLARFASLARSKIPGKLIHLERSPNTP